MHPRRERSKLDPPLNHRKRPMNHPSTDTPFTEIARCELPIQLAPMAGPVTLDLALAVAGAGGHASFGVVMLPPEAVAAQLDRLAAGTRAFSANFIVPLMDLEALDAAIERAPMIDFHCAPPDPALVERVHAGGALVGWQVGSVEQAQAAEAAGCDLLIAQGVEAGGRIVGRLRVADLLPRVLQSVAIPVLAAGGIATAEGVRAALAAGAAGVRVGTRFLASTESGAHPAWIEALIRARAEDTVVTRAFTRGIAGPAAEVPHRVLRSSLEAAQARDGQIVGEMEVAGRVRQIEALTPPSPDRSFRGAVEAMPFYLGESAGEVREVEAAAEIVAELAAGLRLEVTG